MRALLTKKIQFEKTYSKSDICGLIKFYLKFHWIYEGFDYKKKMIFKSI
jgi:hypothetical protein